MITTEQARALRNADSLCFDLDPDGSQIRAIVRGKDYEHERTVTIRAHESSRVENYGSGEGPWHGFHMSMHAQHDEVTRTIVRHLRAGSEFALLWTRNNASPVTDKAGVVVDELRIKIQRGKTVDTFLVYRSVSLDNSARMIREA